MNFLEVIIYTRINKLNQRYHQFKYILDLLPIDFLNKVFKNNVKISKWINALDYLKNGYCPSIQRYLTNWQYNKISNNTNEIFTMIKINLILKKYIEKDIEGYLGNDI